MVVPLGLLVGLVGVASAESPIATESPARAHLDWVLRAMKTPPTPSEANPRFTPEFRKAVGDIPALFAQLRAQLGDVTEVVVVMDDGARVSATVKSAAGPLRVNLAVQGDQIGGLFFEPIVEAPPVATWADVDALLPPLGAQVGLLAAEIVAGQCRPVHAVAPDAPLAIGSTFKLYVLDALAGEVAAGKRRWSDTLPIEDALKSLPTGDMRELPAGSAVSLQALGEAMISVSDNTATDHLLAALGKKAVEAAATASGNSRNAPMLSTHEMFALKLVMPKAQRDAFVKEPKRRRALAETAARTDLTPAYAAVAGWTTPRQIGDIEWFATPSELCQEALALQKRGGDPTVRAILSKNPGVPDASGAWTWMGYKGGSEPGVMNLSWILDRSDGRTFFLTVGVNDPQRLLDENAVINAAVAARALLGRP